MDIVNKELDMPSAGIQHYHDPDISFYSEELELISHSSTKISFTKAFINYFKSIMGISILAVPQVANQTGYIYAILLFTLVFSLALRTNFLLLEVADHSQAQTFGEITHKVLGKKASRFADFAIVTNQTFLCIAYVIFFAKFFQEMFLVFGVNLPSLFYLISSLSFILPIVCISNIQIFTQTSVVGLALGLFVLLSTILYESSEVVSGNTAISTSLQIDFSQTFLFIAVAIGCMEGGLTILPCRSQMQKKEEFKYVLGIAFSLNYFLFILVIYFNSLCYGNQLDQLYLFNLPSHFKSVVTLLYTMNIILTYPIQIYPAHIIIDHLIGKHDKSMNENMTKAKIMLLRLALTLFIYICAYLVPNLIPLIGILGAVFGTLVQFLYPIFLHMFYFKEQGITTKLTYVFLLSFSLMAISFGTYESTRNLLITMK